MAKKLKLPVTDGKKMPIKRRNEVDVSCSMT